MAEAPPAPPQNTPYIGLARRYRPQTFADVVGQEQIANSMAQQVMAGKVAQAYIFSGPRGIGKTSTARILAKSLNCVEGPTPHPCGKCEQCVSIQTGNSMDVIEIDGASNRGIDDIRELQETISQSPFSARKKIYIIDEVHMLTREAFNALLKTLEEPPPFVIFVFATTEFERIPETITSRCQAFMFNRISIDDIVRRLDFVADREGIDIDANERRAVFEAIAFAVDGGMRDAMMALDQLAALSNDAIQLDETTRFLGVVEHDLLIRTVEMLHQRDSHGLLQMVNNLVERGRDLERFVKNLLGFLRDLMIIKAGGGKDLVNLSGDKLMRAQGLLWAKDDSGRQVEVISYPELLNFIQVFMSLEAEIKDAVQVRVHLEFAFVKLTAIEPVIDIARLLSDVESGKKPAAPRRPAPAPEQPKPTSPTEAPAPASPPPKPATGDMFGGNAQRSAETPEAAPEAPAPAAKASDANVWETLQKNRQKLGMGLSLALKEARFGGLEGDTFSLRLSDGSLSTATLEDPQKRARLEAWLAQALGRPISVRIEKTARQPVAPKPTMPAPEPMPVMRDSAPSEAQEGAPAADPQAVDTHALYLKSNPVARAREALKNDATFREKVELVKRFFDGRVFDASGDEIVIQ